MRPFPRLSLAAAAGLALALGAGPALAQNADTANWMDQGGAGWHVGSGGTLTIESGGKLVAQDCLAEFDIRITSALAQTSFVHVADRAEKVAAVRARIATAAGGALTATVNKVANAAAAGTAAPVHAGTINLNAASDTAQNLTPVTTAVATLAAGDALYFALSGAVASTLGVVTVCMAPQ